MIYYVYNYFDKGLQVFDAPILTTEAPDVFKEKVERSLKTVKPFDFQFATNKVLIYFGSFDDVKGKFDLLDDTKLVKLLDTDNVLPAFNDVVNAYKSGTFKDKNNDELIYRLEMQAERERLRAEELKKKVGDIDGSESDRNEEKA